MSFDTPDENTAFHDKHGFAFELWSDVDRSLGLQYSAAKSASQGNARRNTVVLDANGELRAIWKGVANVLGHPSAVLEVCQELFGGR